MSAGAAIAEMAEQTKMKACEKYMLKLSESGDVFEMVVEVLGWEPGQRQGEILYLRLPESRTHWTAILNPCSLAISIKYRQANP
jgi:hypothetical protein